MVLALASDQEATVEFRGPPVADQGLTAEERFSHQVLAPEVNRFLGVAPRADFQAVLADILAVVLAVAVEPEMAAREEQALAAARAQVVVKGWAEALELAVALESEEAQEPAATREFAAGEFRQECLMTSAIQPAAGPRPRPGCAPIDPRDRRTRVP